MTRSSAFIRSGLLVLALALSAASGSQQRSGVHSGPPANAEVRPPAPEPMDPSLALGLYRSSFGPVKIELAPDQASPNVAGVWVYERDGEEVIGLFTGALDGNVLEFQWQEPAQPGPLTGAGFIVFHSDGTGFYGKWWTTAHDRSGDWTGQKYAAEEPVDDEMASPPQPTPPYGETI